MTMPNGAPTPEAKSLRYAEELGLNSVYEEALVKRAALGEKALDITDLRNKRRGLESLKVDLEMAVVEDERGKHPEMSQAQMDKHLKVAFSNNSDIRETKDQINYITTDIDVVEHEIDLLQTDIKIAVARLHELGGYFQFMAVLKSTSEARKAGKASDEGNPWK